MKRKFKISSHGKWTLALAVLAALAVMFAAPLQAGAAVTYDAANPVTSDYSGATRSSVTFAHTVGTCSDRLLIVIVNTRGGETVASVTYNSAGMTSAAVGDEGATSGQRVEIFYLKNPASGGNNVVVTYDATTSNNDGVFALNYCGVDQNTPIGGSNGASATTGNNPTVNVSTSYENSLLVGGAGGHGGDLYPWTPGTGTTERFDVQTGASTFNDDAYTGGDEPTTTTGSYTFDFTANASDNWAIAAVEVVQVQCSATAPSDLAGSDAAGAPVEVDLTWTYDGTNNNYYTVYRDGSPIETNITTGSYTDSTVLPSTTYDYTVRGYNTGEGCESGDSNTANVTTNACPDDVSTITIDPPTSSSTVSGIFAITATVTGESTAPNDYTSMSVTTAGSSSCDVTDAAMTDQGSGVWTYPWNTTACGTSVAETGITINASGTDPDCGTTRNAAQVSDITVDNTCEETASVYLSQVGSTAGLIQQPIRGTVTVSAALLGTGGSNPRVSTNGSTWYAVPYSYSPPASSSGTVTFFVNGTGYCGEIRGAYDPSSVDYNTLANDYTITTCSECHHEPPTDGASRDNPTGAVVGSHYAHDRAGFACTDCHVNNTATDHREGLIEMAGYGANYTEGTSFAQTNNPTLGTCANLNCHGMTTPTWGDNSRTDGDCAICHGMSDSGKTGRDTAGDVATNDPEVGAHATHLNSLNNLSDDVDCAECHTPPVGADYTAKVVEGSGHNDTALPAEISWGPTAVTNDLSPSYSAGTCNNTWCHGTQLGNGDQTPAWDNDLLLTGSNADCQTCHDHPVYGGGTAVQAHQSGAYTSAMSGPDRCKTCHPDMNNSNDYLFDATGNHVDGKIDAWTCITCHDAQQPATGANRRIVTGASGDIGTAQGAGLASHHIQPDASGVQDDTCLACHYQDMPKLKDGVNVRLYDPDSGSIVTYDGTGASVEDFCNNCHDSGGAARLATPSQPFGSSGDTTAPPATGWIKTVSVHKDVDIGADSSKEKCMGCHGKAGAGGGTLDPAQNAHGSGQTKLMRFTYAGTETVTNANNVCYNCHGNPVANGAVDDLESQFGLTSKHSSITCLDCHNVHQAAAGTHAAQDNKAGNVLNGVSGAELTTLPAFAADPVVGDFTAKTIVGGTDLEATLCFKCHTVYNSSYNASSPSGSYNMTDVAREFNPNNVGNYAGTWASGETAGSFHPVLAAATGNLGRTNNVISPWTTDSVMSCTDCHDSDTTTDPKGPHGSAAGFILRGPNTTWTTTVTSLANNAWMPTGTFCLNCHANNDTNGRFPDHSRGNHSVNCSKCHVMIPHGSEHPGLLHTAAGRGAGVPAPTWTNNAPYMRASTGNRLYIASYPSSQSSGWGQSNCGCNGSGH